MRINREARQTARSYFRACFTDGQLDEGKARKVVSLLAKHRPRNHMQVLQRLRKLVDLEIESHTFMVESAEELADKGASVFAQLENRFGKPLDTRYALVPDLLGGIRIRCGSNVWDGSIRARLQQLENAIINPA